jgi:tRNA modification GTPase
MRGLKGALSTELGLLEKNLLQLLSHLEASIDFSDQEIEPFSWEQQKRVLGKIQKRVIKIVKGFQQGRINREGFSVILLGAPNAGKSSLFNCLIQEDKAIVTKHPGTTRDILSARLLLNQREFCLKDTAGFRGNPDIVEKRGIEKVLEELSHSDLCLFLVEGFLPFDEKSVFGLELLDKSKTIVVFSKSDRIDPSEKKSFLEKFVCFCEKKESIKKFSEKVRRQPVWLSSRTGEGIEELKETFSRESEKEVDEVFLSTPRQKESLEKVNHFLAQAKTLFDKKASPEFIAFELQSALSILYGLLGREYNEEVIQQIFKEFCIGK